jgi:hypothetical protein
MTTRIDPLDFVLKDLPPALRADLKPALTDRWNAAAGAEGLPALDPTVGGGGGAAFLWEDVLAVGDLIDATRPFLESLAPNEGAKLLVDLLGIWRRLREQRVVLDEAEFAVLRAVKRGCHTPQQVASYSGLDAPVVAGAIERLKTRQYRREISLIEESAAGLITRF